MNGKIIFLVTFPNRSLEYLFKYCILMSIYLLGRRHTHTQRGWEIEITYFVCFWFGQRNSSFPSQIIKASKFLPSSVQEKICYTYMRMTGPFPTILYKELILGLILRPICLPPWRYVYFIVLMSVLMMNDSLIFIEFSPHIAWFSNISLQYILVCSLQSYKNNKKSNIPVLYL